MLIRTGSFSHSPVTSWRISEIDHNATRTQNQATHPPYMIHNAELLISNTSDNSKHLQHVKQAATVLLQLRRQMLLNYHSFFQLVNAWTIHVVCLLLFFCSICFTKSSIKILKGAFLSEIYHCKFYLLIIKQTNYLTNLLISVFPPPPSPPPGLPLFGFGPPPFGRPQWAKHNDRLKIEYQHQPAKQRGKFRNFIK